MPWLVFVDTLDLFEVGHVNIDTYGRKFRYYFFTISQVKFENKFNTFFFIYYNVYTCKVNGKHQGRSGVHLRLHPIRVLSGNQGFACTAPALVFGLTGAGVNRTSTPSGFIGKQ